MDEQDFRATLSKEELERRAFMIPFKVTDFALLERLNHYSTEFDKTWDELINSALIKFMDDIETIHKYKKLGQPVYVFRQNLEPFYEMLYLLRRFALKNLCQFGLQLARHRLI